MDSRPPVFFFAAPAHPPFFPKNTLGVCVPVIYPLVTSCLLSTDPLAEQVAWGLLGGNLVALRREITSRQYNQPRYLLLPTSVKAANAQPIVEGILVVSPSVWHSLNSRFAMRLSDVYTDMEPLEVRRALWSGTLDTVNSITSEAIDLMSSVHKSHFRRINDRLAALHLVLRRLQASIETGASDANQVESLYKGYLDSTQELSPSHIHLFCGAACCSPESATSSPICLPVSVREATGRDTTVL